MAFKVNYLSKMKKGWICSHCKRKNDKEDEKCAFCGEGKSALKSKNKFNSSRTQYGNRWYHSRKEAEYAERLDLQKLAGEIQEWTPQYKIDIKVNGVHICAYYMDFLVTLHDGSRQYIEVKGMESEIWRLKWKLCMALKDQIDAGAEWIIVK